MADGDERHYSDKAHKDGPDEADVAMHANLDDTGRVDTPAELVQRLSDIQGTGSGARDAEKTSQVDPLIVPAREWERLNRIMSAPWLQSYAASTAHITNSLRHIEGLDRMLNVEAKTDLTRIYKGIENTLLPFEEFSRQQAALLKPVTQALTSFIEKTLRDATLAGFAKKTQQWLTTTEPLRYASNNSVWHYTNGYACLSIIKNGCLWASSPESLNDASEMTHGLKLIREAFNKVVHEAEEDADNPMDWTTVKLLMAKVLDEKYFDAILNEVYYISASTQPDSLTLWRNYASGDGFALGLTTKVELSADGIALDDNEDSGSLRDDVPPISGWYRVTYKKNQKERLATEFVQNAFEDIDRAGASDHEGLVTELRKQAVILASVMKHDAFQDEKEVRWITTNFTNFDPVHYEHGRRSIVPVLHVRTASQDEKALLPLRGVRCSPVAPEGIVRTVRGLLLQEDYERASRNVKKSEQPFKG